jgi:hypothetical protein
LELTCLSVSVWLSVWARTLYLLHAGIGVFPVSFTQGGLNRTPLPKAYVTGDSEFDAVYSWAGWGGSTFLVNPHRKAAGVFCSNAMTWDISTALLLLYKAIRIGWTMEKEGKAPEPPVAVSRVGRGSSLLRANKVMPAKPGIAGSGIPASESTTGRPKKKSPPQDSYAVDSSEYTSVNP